MSAVDDVDMRLCRLEESLQLTQTQLLELSTQRQYDPTRGVDVDHSGRSVATIEVNVLAARNMNFQNGLLAGKGTYVRATLDPPGAALELEPKCTEKRAVAPSPCWQETLVFQGMSQLHSRLVVEVLQEERLGADRVVGALVLDVSSLHDQRPIEKWHALVTRDNQPTMGQLYLGCRLNRSVIFALELESELLQNQIRELRAFVERQRRLAPAPAVASTRVTAAFARTPSDRSLDGKEVSTSVLLPAPQRTPPPARRLQQLDARLEAMHSPVVAVRKRERRLSLGPHSLLSPSHAATAVSAGAAMAATASLDLQQPRIKRRKLEPVTETHVDSLSMRLANWLLPAAPPVTASAMTPMQASPPKPQPWGFGVMTAATASSSQHQQPHQQTGGGPHVAVSPIRPHRPTHHHHHHAAAKKKKKSSALAALEQWLFQDPQPPTYVPSVEMVHAQMRAES